MCLCLGDHSRKIVRDSTGCRGVPYKERVTYSLFGLNKLMGTQGLPETHLR